MQRKPVFDVFRGEFTASPALVLLQVHVNNVSQGQTKKTKGCLYHDPVHRTHACKSISIRRLNDCFFHQFRRTKLVKFLHVNSEEESQDEVVLRAKSEHNKRQASLDVEGKEDDSVVAKVVEEILTAQY